MNRRKFVTAVGVGVAASLVASKIAMGQSRKPDRIITLDSPKDAAKCFRIFKGGQQIGCVYWANVDTKQYRRVALWVDFALASDFAAEPWDGGRIVRHPNQAGKSKIVFGPLHWADLDMMYEGPAMKGTRVASSNHDKESWSYPIDQYPVVDYESYHSNRGGNYTNCRTTPLSVEGTCDEIQISENAPPDLLALYSDLPRFKPSKPVVDEGPVYVYDFDAHPKRPEPVITEARTADELAEEMRRWVAGETDSHDEIVNEYKRRVIQRG